MLAELLPVAKLKSVSGIISFFLTSNSYGFENLVVLEELKSPYPSNCA